MKHILLTSASILAFTAPLAQAQAPVGQAAPAGIAPQDVASSPAGSAKPAKLEEIIVTAQRTAQAAQKAPLPISVIRPAELTRDNVVRSEDLSRAVPALVAANNGGETTAFFLRGVGNFTSNSYSDPAIAFNYDGVYIGRPTNTQGLFYDLQRVEVLEGPQGTLYGRNATGGAINVIPNKPVIGQTSEAFQVGYGNYNALETQGDINMPIGENAAFRLSAMYDRHDGYLSDGTSDQNIGGVRGQFLVNITPDLTTRLAVDYTHDGGAGTGAYQYGTTFFNGRGYSFASAPGLDPSIGLADPRTEAFLQKQFLPQVGRNAEALGNYPNLDDSFWGITDETSWHTSFGTLTIQAAYRHGDINSDYTTPDFRDSLTNEQNHQTTVEARFAGKVGPVDYLVGGYFFNEGITDRDALNQLLLTAFQDYTTGTDSKAAFARLAWHVTPTVTLTAGGRYTRDVKTFDGISDNYILFCGNGGFPQNFCPSLPLEPYVNTGAQLASFYRSRDILVSPIPLGILGFLPPNTSSVLNTQIPIDATTTTGKFTYRLAADWQVVPGSLLYASYETGFHGGGFSFARGLDSYQPETIDAYTIGSKNRFLDNTLQINVEAFYWKYNNQQFSQFGYDLGTPPALVFYTSNVGRSTNKGFDTSADAFVTPTTRLSGGVQYLSAVYDNFITYAPNQGLPPNVACPYTPVNYHGAASFSINCAGRPGFNAPKWAFNLDVAQTINLENYRIVLEGDTRYRGDYYVAPTYQPWLLSKAAFTSDLSITLSPQSDRWFATAYVNNIEDIRRIVQVTTNGLNTLTAITSDPLTCGFRVGGRF